METNSCKNGQYSHRSSPFAVTGLIAWALPCFLLSGRILCHTDHVVAAGAGEASVVSIASSCLVFGFFWSWRSSEWASDHWSHSHSDVSSHHKHEILPVVIASPHYILLLTWQHCESCIESIRDHVMTSQKLLAPPHWKMSRLDKVSSLIRLWNGASDKVHRPPCI